MAFWSAMSVSIHFGRAWRGDFLGVGQLQRGEHKERLLIAGEVVVKLRTLTPESMRSLRTSADNAVQSCPPSHSCMEPDAVG